MYAQTNSHHFGNLTFRQETFWHFSSLGNFKRTFWNYLTFTSSILELWPYLFRHCRHTGTWTFRHKDFSARGHFGTRNFRHHELFGTGYFGTWIFRHMDILAPCKAIWTFWNRPFGTCATVPKCPHAETSMVPKNPCAKKSPCWKVLVPKRPLRRNLHVPECLQARTCTCRNVPVMKCLCRNVSGRNVKCRNAWWEAAQTSLGRKTARFKGRNSRNWKIYLGPFF